MVAPQMTALNPSLESNLVVVLLHSMLDFWARQAELEQAMQLLNDRVQSLEFLLQIELTGCQQRLARAESLAAWVEGDIVSVADWLDGNHLEDEGT